LEHLANLLGRFQEAEATFFALDLSIRRYEFVLATKALIAINRNADRLHLNTHHVFKCENRP